MRVMCMLPLLGNAIGGKTGATIGGALYGGVPGALIANKVFGGSSKKPATAAPSQTTQGVVGAPPEGY